MFERLLQLPLFQGLTLSEISDVMSHVRLNFINYHAGDEIVIQGDNCHNLIYIINGRIASEYRHQDGLFTLTEDLPDTKVLEPYNMFGMYQKFSRSYSFTTDGITLSIEKPFVLKHLIVNDIIKINLLNIVCNKYQQTARLLQDFPDNNARYKIIKFILAFSSTPKGSKKVRIKMQDLANHIHETRLNVSIALNAMQEEGLLTLQRGEVGIKDLQALARWKDARTQKPTD